MRNISVLLLFISLFFLASCVTNKNIAYFQPAGDTSQLKTQQITSQYEPRIQPDDILGINVTSINPDATAIFNQPVSTMSVSNSAAGNTSLQMGGYLVNSNGYIDFPVLGKIKVEGLTTQQTKDTIRRMLLTSLQEPTVDVRFLNFKITVLGEVTHPATFTVPNEKVTVLDALGMAGDMTIYGKRDNVLVIREENGKRKFGRLNLSSQDVFQSPYFYLKQNDVVYVEPNKTKKTSAETNTRNISILLAVLSTLSIVATTIIRLK